MAPVTTSADVRVATIDLGTNAVRFDVHRLTPAGPVRLHRERLPIRLGQGVFQTRRLAPSAFARALAAFHSFQRTARGLRVEKITAVGTSALRTASNSDDLLRRLRRDTGIDVRVITGAEEARLIALAIVRDGGLVKGKTALVDVGGGSSEITLCREGRAVRSRSFDLGAARLQQMFLKAHPPVTAKGGESAVERLRDHARHWLADGAPRGGWPRVDRIVGSGGTIRALARLQEARDGGDRLSRRELRRLAESLGPLTLPRLLRVPGMEPKRADTILAGALLLDEIAEALGADEIAATELGLRDGLLAEEWSLYRRGRPPALAFHLSEVEAAAARLGVPEAHLKRMSSFASILFDRLRPLHGLEAGLKNDLVAACFLLDAGETISPIHRERHAAYVARNIDVPSLGEEERELIAQLCLWHRGGKVDGGRVPFWKDRGKRVRFMKLLALVRVVDSLDSLHSRRVRVTSVERRGADVRVCLAGDRTAAELERLRAEQKKELFETLFRVRLSVVID
jgi:exopolyphosphatase/guanosine-5'-triphosphate,3'-diphosphate pyrophosphatase